MGDAGEETFARVAGDRTGNRRMNHESHMHQSDHHDRTGMGHEMHGDHATHASDDAHDKHAGHSPQMFRDKFWWSVALTIPTIVWSPMVQQWLGFHAPRFPGSQYIPAVFGTLLFFYGGIVFLRGAGQEIKDRLPGMMTLISLAITVSFVFSLAVTFGVPGMDLWWELSTLITIMILGHWIEMRSIMQAQGALSELAKLVPDMATRIAGDKVEDVPIAELRQRDIVLVRPGASVPADGLVRDGTSAVNESMITGESRPVDKKPGAKVIAGTINGAGSLRFEVTGTGDQTALAGIMRLVAQAQGSRSRAQALADRAAFFLTVIAVAAAILTLVGWLLAGASASFAIERAVTVLVIACPHALGLAIPLVIAISTTIAARQGLLVRNRRGLEDARNLNAIIFDKTGTLTRGEFRVVEITTATGLSADEALGLAASVERDSEHTIAQGVVKSADERGLSSPRAESFQAIPGEGAQATIEGRQLMIGGPALLRRAGVSLDGDLQKAMDKASQNAQTAIVLIEGVRPLAVLAIADAIRPESREAVQRLHDQKIQVIMMTGDSTAVANAVAKELGIDTVMAEVSPEQKASKVKELRDAGKRVGMVGDGVNDAPALATADVAIAIGAGTDVAVEAGDVVLIRSDPRDVPRIISLSKAAYRKMIQNLWWAAGYNIVALPLAAGVLASRGIVLNPAMGAILMSLSTVVVALNAQLLRRGQRVSSDRKSSRSEQ
jgi:P-type Cu2+ transporter